MSLLLHIETSSHFCSVAVSQDGEVTASRETGNANHAAALTVFIQQAMKEVNRTLASLDAICLSAGPGSYTGLRIGAATAKGLCFTLSKPLITIDTLQALAFGMQWHNAGRNCLYCATVDARRNEIYYGIFRPGGDCVQPSVNAIVSPDLMNSYADYDIVVGGSGAEKCMAVLEHPAISYDTTTHFSARWMVHACEKKWRDKDFTDVTSFEPNYVKPVFITSMKNKNNLPHPPVQD